MRLIDADELRAIHSMGEDCIDCHQNVRHCQYDRNYTKMDFCGWLDDAPTVDAVPVVRCRDCLYWQKSSLFRGHTVCRYVLDCSVVRREDDFCSRGERKDGEAHD